MRIVIIGIACLMMMSGCSVTNNNTVKKEVKDGIIDACYTVLEYNPQDKEVRINKYLDSKEKKNDITPEQKQIIKSCLSRTQKSTRWQK